MKKRFLKLLESVDNRYTPVQVFTDFVTLSAISISNSLTPNKALEDEYNSIAAKYSADGLSKFAEMLAVTAEALEEKYCDFLGECFSELGATNAKTGQFFTPYSLSKLSALATFDASKEFQKINEPACGSGSMIIAMCEVMQEHNYNYQTNALFIAQDIDYRCGYMCYVQLSLLGVPAIVNIGDTLKVEVWQELHTPVYVFNYLHFRGR